MKVDKAFVEKVAQAARLQLTEDEIGEFVPQLKEVLETFSKIDKVDIKGTKPSFQPIPLKNVTREDRSEKCLTQEQALSQTKHKKDGYFMGPKVV